MSKNRLDPDKLLENALISIRLGVEDFSRSQIPVAEGGDLSRALSAVRNLFSGTLLLFKYKLAISFADPDSAANIIFKTKHFLPYRDGHGGVEWKPVFGSQKVTIDISTMEQRFKALDIEVDWKVIKALQECRNDLEHLHTSSSFGEVCNFVANLFPVLRDFVANQLNMEPSTLFGVAWLAMLNHHEFFISTQEDCRREWQTVGVPQKMYSYLMQCRCEFCGSSLLKPNADDLEEGLQLDSDSSRFRYKCFMCGQSELITPLMIDLLNELHEYDPRDGGEPLVEECFECRKDTFMIDEQTCLWCEAELDYIKCSICDEALGQDEQGNSGLCSYHFHLMQKD